MTWILGIALFVVLILAHVWGSRQNINRLDDDAETDATYRRRATYEADSSRPE